MIVNLYRYLVEFAAEKHGVDPIELRKGIKVEHEHTDDDGVAMKIALDHLHEDGRYYSKLETLGL